MMGRLPRCSIPFPLTDSFIGPDLIVSGPGKNDRRKQSSLPDYVHIVAEGGDSGDFVVRPSGGVQEAPAGPVGESGRISGDSAGGEGGHSGDEDGMDRGGGFEGDSAGLGGVRQACSDAIDDLDPCPA
jgi:hypothetical protein